MREWRRRFDVYLVGGVVRDGLLYGEGKRVEDCDVVLRGGRDTLKGFVSHLKGEGFVLKKWSVFGTAELKKGNLNLDVALLRREFYAYPGALPQVEFTDSLEEDSRRRDFTVNALYCDGEKILDFHGGVRDLKMRLLKPLASFADDPTRALRGVRYRHKLGFSYHPSFFESLKDAQRYIPNVSPQRITNEVRLTALLRKKSFLGALKEGVGFGLLRTILKEGYKPPDRVYLGRPSPHRWVVPLAPFLKEDLPLTGEEREAVSIPRGLRVKNLVDVHMNMHRWSDLKVLVYTTWEAGREREMLRFYLRFRGYVRVKVYPMEERLKSLKEIARRFSLREIPEICLAEAPKPHLRQRYRLMCEGEILQKMFRAYHSRT